MNREEVRDSILNISTSHKNILIELPTGYGKTKQALDIVKKHIKLGEKILIVIPRIVLINSWKEEIKKWKLEKYLSYVTFTTYVSLPKHADKWELIIFDECHHLSERCRESLTSFTINRSILLSATVKLSIKDELREVFDNLYCYKISMREAIDNEVLPDPTIYLLPLTLNNSIQTETIVKNPKGHTPAITTDWNNRWSYIKQKDRKVLIKCTERQYYSDLDSQIEWFKNKYMRSNNDIFRNKWLRLAGERLKWLSNSKNRTVYNILKKLDKERTLTFCNSIEQTELLGSYCINSKNKNSLNILDKFNSGKINHITACNMLNEGMNLVNCRIGIYANLNSSETIVKQRLGRLLRHKNPIVIIPYFIDTREEELVNKMIEDYNEDLIKIITDINEIKL